jgi:flavin reductase (DIM6/NTAB) family NADH-FMN oxidoreductase RutF
MTKQELGARNCLYPLPVVIVGAIVKGRPNFVTIAHVGIMDLKTISLGMNKTHFTKAGIFENRTFSVNIPSVDLVEKTDYSGLVSGRDIDKAQLFKIFYGKLKTAPMIEECPVNMECTLVKNVDFPAHDIFMGEVVATYCDESVLDERGMLDYALLRPILFTMNDAGYWRLGERFATAWSIGKGLKG